MIRFLFAFLTVSLSHGAYEWHSVQIRGGGYVHGVQFHPSTENLAYIRTDVGGAYKYNSSDHSWIALNDAFNDGNDMGSMAIGLDPDNPEVVYSTGGLYTDLAWCGEASFLRSSDRGKTWEKLPLNTNTVSGTDNSKVTSSGSLCLAGNGTGRGTGNRIAAKGQTIYLGTSQNGLLKSTNKGSNWESVDYFSTSSGVSAVQFDKNGNIYAAPYGGGVFYSNDGQNWTQLGSFSQTVYQMSYNPTNNELWLTVNSSNPLDQNSAGGGAVYKCDLDNKTAAEIDMPQDYNGFLGISVNPQDAQQIVVSTVGTWGGNGGPIDGASFKSHEGIYMSVDGGATWKDIVAHGVFDANSAYNAASSNPHWMSALAINPFDGNHVTFGTGYGMWSTFDAKAENPTWIYTSTGIEETVPLGLASTPKGAPLVSVVGDVDGFYHSNLDTPPLSRHKLSDSKSEAGTNYDLAWAQNQPEIMVRVHKNSNHGLGAYSDDGGLNWTNFASHPDASGSGENNFIAISADASTIVWNMANSGMHYSTDQGKTWQAASNTAIELSGFRPVADKINANVFYLYNAGSGKLYQSSDKGINWAVINSDLAQVDDWAYGNMNLFSSPAQEGELWVTQGANIYACAEGCSWSDNFKGGLWFGDGKVLRSTDGGASFKDVNGFLYGRQVAFGKGKTEDFAIYLVGMANDGTQGVFRSDDNGTSWTRVNDDNHQFGGVDRIGADPCIYSRIYISGSGRGIIYGQEPGSVNTSCSERSDFNKPTKLAPKPSITYSWQRQQNMITSKQSLTLRNVQGRIVEHSLSGEVNLTNHKAGIYLLQVGNSPQNYKIFNP
ncbi:MAG: hypothetical protein GX801_07055 [Fibrobacter sp.]|nr:hypothetical protein [Fibrobacter sp.]